MERFVVRLLDGEPMTDVSGFRHIPQDRLGDFEPVSGARLCRFERSLAAIVKPKRNKLRWGARKIRELLVRRLAGDDRVPTKSTIHPVLTAMVRSGAWPKGNPRYRNPAVGGHHAQ